MCGIAGIQKLKSATTLVERDDLVTMASVMAHRGPDEGGFALLNQGKLGLAHVRLSIVDVATGQQPLFSADGAVGVSFNGEIYDYQQHRADLLALGYPLKTHSDTEALIYLYIEYGLSFLDRLNGEFAFLLWDGRTQKLLAARDRIGVKPLFYAERSDEVLFASEAKGIASLARVDRAISNEYLTGPFFGITPSTTSLLQGVRALAAGHYLVVGPQGVEAERPYWKPQYRPDTTLSFDDAKAGVRDHLTRAVQRRMVADVPVCSYLSGGLDSTLVCGLMSQQRSGVKAFTVAFSGSEYDEAEKARLISRHFGVEFEPVECSMGVLAEQYEHTLFHTETFIANPSAVAKMRLSARVRDAGFKVALTGEGADEVFAGYPYFKLEKLWRMELAGGEQAELAKKLWPQFRTIEARSEGLMWNRKNRWQKGPHPFGYPSFQAVRADEYGALIPRLFQSERLGFTAEHSPTAIMRKHFDPNYIASIDPLQGTLCMSLQILGGMIIPTLGDRVEMAHSVEGRTPFLDRDLLEFSFRLPPEYLIRIEALREKYVLREAFADLIPKEVLGDHKHPFMAPDWWTLSRTKRGGELMAEMLSPTALRRAGIFNVDFIRLARLLWAMAPRGSGYHKRLDVLLGIALGIQVLHRLFVENRPQAAVSVTLYDRSPSTALQ